MLCIVRGTMAVAVAMTKLGKAHDHDLNDEQEEDGYQADTLDPVVLSDWSGKTFVRQSFMCRCKQLLAISLCLS